MSKVNRGATVPEVTALLTNQGSGFSQGSLGTQSDGLWDRLFWAAQRMEIQRGLACSSISFINRWLYIIGFYLTLSAELSYQLSVLDL